MNTPFKTKTSKQVQFRMGNGRKQTKSFSKKLKIGVDMVSNPSYQQSSSQVKQKTLAKMMWRNVLTYQVVLFEKVMPMKIKTKNAECTSFDSRKQPQIMTNSLTAWWTSSSNSWATNIFVRILGKLKYVSTCSSTLYLFCVNSIWILQRIEKIIYSSYFHVFPIHPPSFEYHHMFCLTFNKHHQRAFKSRPTKKCLPQKSAKRTSGEQKAESNVSK